MSNASNAVLRAYFATVISLNEYLSLVATQWSEKESDAVAVLTQTVLVGTQAMREELPRYQAKNDYISMAEVIDQAHGKLFSQNKGIMHHVIAYGYREASFRNEPGKTLGPRHPISNYFTNTIVTALKSAEWQDLLDIVGMDIMLHLLTSASLFQAVRNGAYVQITGVSIVELEPLPTQRSQTAFSSSKRKVPNAADDVEERSRKRIRTNDHHEAMKSQPDPSAVPQIRKSSNQTKKPVKRSPVDIPIPRSFIFYARPSWKDSKRIILGFPPPHLLNACKWPSAQTTPLQNHTAPAADTATTEPHPPARKSETEMNEEACARSISKHVFPRQYGLPSIFDCEDLRQPPTYASTLSAISVAGTQGTPKRLKHVLPMISKLADRHSKFRYRAVCNLLCPSKLKKRPETLKDHTAILEIMSETTSQQLPSSIDISHPSLVIPHGASQARAAMEAKPRFMEFAFRHSQVSRFVIAVVESVIPQAFWGGKQNFNVVASHIRTFVKARRHESISLHHVLQNFLSSECDWLAPRQNGPLNSRNQRTSHSDSIKRREILEDFMYWFFGSFVVPLIRGTFFVTDSSMYRGRVLYFRHDDWDVLCRPLIERLSTTTFRKLIYSKEELSDAMRVRSLGYAYVRLKPKETGVRPIVNLRRKVDKGNGPPRSVNQVLQAAFQILSYEKMKQPDLLGADSFGNMTVYHRLKSFQTKLLQDHGGVMPKLYFVKVDVQACFDTIDQDKLLSILAKIMTHDRYMLTRYSQVSRRSDKIWRSFKRQAGPDFEHTHFLPLASKLASSLRQAVFVDRVVYEFHDYEEVLKLLGEHIKENIVKIGKQFFQQTVGIPQGSVLSALLCSFFYGDMEKNHLNFADNPQCLLLRWVDDFLFISSDKDKADKFLDAMSQGHPEYGCFISRDKTLTNFHCDKYIPSVIPADTLDFPWCGLTINVHTLHVSVDYQRYKGQHIADTLTVNRGRRSGAEFRNRMLHMCRQRVQPIFIDTNFNSTRIVYLNLYYNFMLTAMKMHHYLRSWGSNARPRTSFIMNTIDESVHGTWSAVTAKMASDVVQAEGGHWMVKKESVLWLGFYAFRAVLSRKPTSYSTLLGTLDEKLAAPEFADPTISLQSLARKGFGDLSHIIVY